MLNYLTLIFACQLVGETVVTTLKLPVPGPVGGMVLLFVYLVIRGEVPAQLASIGGGLLSSLSLLFVPAGVGVMLHLRLLEDDWLALSLALVISTLAAIVVTAYLMVWLTKGSGGSRSDGDVQARAGRQHD